MPVSKLRSFEFSEPLQMSDRSRPMRVMVCTSPLCIMAHIYENKGNVLNTKDDFEIADSQGGHYACENRGIRYEQDEEGADDQ